MPDKHMVQKAGHHPPHGLSREPTGGALVPALIGIGCAVFVLVVFWVAYTYL